MAACDAAVALDFRRELEDLQQSWQGRCLRETHDKGKLGAVVLSVLSHNYDDALPILLRAVFAGFQSIAAPFICSAAKIDKRGFIVADVVLRDNCPVRKNYILFYSIRDMEAAFRRLADHLKLDDSERREMFGAVQRWVVADRRLDPTMDPADPDARRLTVH